MKDYYYILGVSRTASPEEIRRAYRKLSTKFHPDKNGGDKFFEDRFKEINEAYGVLANSAKRTAYDRASQQSSEAPPPPRPDPPKIISFTANKTAAALNDVITFKWQVENATSVELKPFGVVRHYGQKSIKVLETV